MKKEVLIAIVIGFALGLIITFGLWSANRRMGQENEEEIQPTPTASILTPTPTPVPDFYLEITSPPNNYLSDQDSLEIKGKTNPETIVVFLYNEGEMILKSEQDGSFAGQIELVGGVNEVRISAFDQEGHEAEEILSIIYSTAEI